MEEAVQRLQEGAMMATLQREVITAAVHELQEDGRDWDEMLTAIEELQARVMRYMPERERRVCNIL
jgi:hypothetical protein